MNNSFEFYVDRLDSVDFIDPDFIFKLNRESKEYFDLKGVNATSRELPSGRGGGEMISAIAQIIGYVTKAYSNLRDVFILNSKVREIKTSPTFSVNIFFEFDTGCVWSGEDNISHIINQLIMHYYQLSKHLKTKYPEYCFNANIHFSYKSFNYSLEINIPDYSNLFYSKGQLIYLLRNVSIKSNLNENIFFTRKLFVKQVLEYYKDEKIVGKKIYYYLKGFQIRTHLLRTRNLRRVKHSKGRFIEPKHT